MRFECFSSFALFSLTVLLNLVVGIDKKSQDDNSNANFENFLAGVSSSLIVLPVVCGASHAK